MLISLRKVKKHCAIKLKALSTLSDTFTIPKNTHLYGFYLRTNNLHNKENFSTYNPKQEAHTVGHESLTWLKSAIAYLQIPGTMQHSFSIATAIRTKIWPCRKEVKGNPRIII